MIRKKGTEAKDRQMASLKTLTLWSEGQLAKLVRESLKDRIFYSS